MATMTGGPIVVHSHTILKGFMPDETHEIIVEPIAAADVRNHPESIRGGAAAAATAGYAHRHQEQHERQQLQRHQPPPPPHPPIKQTTNVQPQPPPPRDPYAAPPPPKDLPLRFLRAGKGDPVEGQRRYDQTLAWRRELGMDNILKEAHPNFELIKQHYPHYHHLRGRNNEPVYYEKPPKTNLKALRAGGVGLEKLLRHYAMITEYGWQCVERDDFARSITILDLEGIRLTDFAGECIDYVRKASAFTGAHYPERAGHVFIINVPSWFKVIWNVVKPMLDEVTLKKISILRNKEEIFNAMVQKIPIENIPPEYGGRSMPLGYSPEEQYLRDMMKHNNDRAQGKLTCNGVNGQPPCPFCTFQYARSY